jgi:ribonuclease Z
MTAEIFMLGTGGSMPLPHRSLTSALLRREGELFLFDCGEGTQVSLRRLNLRWKSINAIFISHTHADHITGLPGLLMLSSQVERDEPLYIIGPPRIAEYIESSRRILEMYVNYDIIVQEIANPSQAQTVFEREDYYVRSFPLRHTRVCVGYSFIEKPRPGIFNPDNAVAAGVPRGPLWSKLQSGESVPAADGRLVSPAEVLGPARRGRKVTFVTDTLPVPVISEEARDADWLLCEGMFEEALAETAHEKKHMTAAEAARLAKASSGIRNLGLMHFSPRYTDKELKLLLDEAKAIFPAASLLRDRQNIVLPLTDEAAG